jgi:hypothetical protein
MMIPPTANGKNKLRPRCVVGVISPKPIVRSVTFEK